MKKIAYPFLFFSLLVILAACNDSEGTINHNDQDAARPTSTDNARPSVKGVKDVDVLNTHGRSIEGLERMQKFYEDAQNGKPSNLRIVHYTIEGDPIVTDLKYNGDTMELIHDSSHDKFGSGEITTFTCNGLMEEVNPTNTTYIAVGCSDGLAGMLEILAIDYNVARQDLFELELKYGKKLGNEVNTKTSEMTKVMNSKETMTTSDFQLSSKVKQEVYKQLVMANYLGDIELKNNCHTENTEEYYFKVYINGGEREFNWSSCDESAEGSKFSRIAEYIIAQSEMKQDENPDIVIQGYILQVNDDSLLMGVDLNRMDYEWLKDEIHQIDLSAYAFNFISLEGVNKGEYRIGDKIEAILKGSITGSNPGKAHVKEIKSLDIPDAH